MGAGVTAQLPVVAGALGGRDGWWFTCEACGRRSALFSQKDSAKEWARSHPVKRCPR